MERGDVLYEFKPPAVGELALRGYFLRSLVRSFPFSRIFSKVMELAGVWVAKSRL
jgi:hypothetical protein